MAQTEALAIDEQGKYIVYELVAAKGISKDQLKERAITFFKIERKDLKLKSNTGDTTFSAAGKLIINKTVLVMSHPSGEVVYHFQSEVKNEKFRFWLTDFSFVPYQRDRYGNFVATTNKGTPLENNPGKLNEAQWKEYRSQTATYAIQFSKEFKNYMLNTQAKTQSAVKKVVSKEW